ncbi:PD40 domain-containing protein [bacterium]|nr:PD40 domain-containing protein [bacterium]
MGKKRILTLLVKILFIVCFSFVAGCGGNHSQVIPQPQQPQPEPPQIPFEPWDGIIAFRFEEGDDYSSSQLWLITPDDKKMITDGAYRYGSIRWSPDGKYLAFRESSKRRLVIASRDGQILHTFGEADEQISWSVDSSYVLSGVYFDGIYYYAIDGSSKRVLPSAYRTYDHNPVQSRDGKWVYFLHHEWEVQCTIYRIETEKLLKGATYSDCEVIAKITTDSSIRDERVQLEPREDGKIIIAYDDYLGLLDPEAKKLEKISSGWYSYIRLSPDGKYLATENTIMDAYTFQKVVKLEVPDYGSIKSFAWYPDSKALAIAARYYSSPKVRVYIWRFSDPRYQLVFEKTLPKSSSRYAYGEQSVSISWTR